jgi:hypothetical protein
MSYTPDESEKRVIAWLRGNAAKWQFSQANEAKVAAAASITIADAIEQGRHHDH